ncbi:CPBP family intramembrane glutamic endopeptidase [Streptococcus hillyeri]|uniref:CPBP family intramembrane metalloprotease n=1 Tax=Streptococcus hillyeri TaxID=2282420 RepID=A0A3L9DX98_9STRE|nr:CPBP family intramembrane glutamic endopeptidase [Streptococcus hillyeri]RLY03420.1 CPBP family intramembrane metalloprotease [Streptococcus hillyeri]
MKKVKNIYLQVILLEFFLIGILTILKVVLPSQPTVRSLLQGFILIALYMYLNRRLLRVDVNFYSKHVSIKEQLISLIPIFIYILVSLIPNIVLEFQSQFFVSALLIGLVAGIMEEYIFRGLFLGCLVKYSQGNSRKLWFALVLSSSLFGLTHAANFLVQPVAFTVYQIITSGIMGMLFGALYLRTQSLVWVILVHFLQDFTVIVIKGFEETVQQTINWWQIPVAIIIFGGVTLFLLRPKMMKKVILQHRLIAK